MRHFSGSASANPVHAANRGNSKVEEFLRHLFKEHDLLDETDRDSSLEKKSDHEIAESKGEKIKLSLVFEDFLSQNNLRDHQLTASEVAQYRITFPGYRFEQGDTLLHIIIRAGLTEERLQIAAVLLAHCSQINLQNVHGRNAFHELALNSRRGLLLLEALLLTDQQLRTLDHKHEIEGAHLPSGNAFPKHILSSASGGSSPALQTSWEGIASRSRVSSSGSATEADALFSPSSSVQSPDSVGLEPSAKTASYDAHFGLIYFTASVKKYYRNQLNHEVAKQRDIFGHTPAFIAGTLGMKAVGKLLTSSAKNNTLFQDIDALALKPADYFAPKQDFKETVKLADKLQRQGIPNTLWMIVMLLNGVNIAVAALRQPSADASPRFFSITQGASFLLALLVASIDVYRTGVEWRKAMLPYLQAKAFKPKLAKPIVKSRLKHCFGENERATAHTALFLSASLAAMILEILSIANETNWVTAKCFSITASFLLISVYSIASRFFVVETTMHRTLSASWV